MLLAGADVRAQVTMTDRDDSKLIALAAYLVPNDSSLSDALRLSVENPDAYYAAYAQQLRYRGISKACPPFEVSLPWIALVDGLHARGRLIEIGWNDALEEMAHAMDQLLVEQPANATRWDWLKSPEWSDRYPEQTFAEIGQRLFDKGLVLLQLDIVADSAPLMILPAERLEGALQLAASAGYLGIRSHGGLICWCPPSAAPDVSACLPWPVDMQDRRSK
jgi:hypothetical protein